MLKTLSRFLGFICKIVVFFSDVWLTFKGHGKNPMSFFNDKLSCFCLSRVATVHQLPFWIGSPFNA